MRPNNTRTQRQIADLFVNVLTNGSIERIDSPRRAGEVAATLGVGRSTLY